MALSRLTFTCKRCNIVENDIFKGINQVIFNSTLQQMAVLFIYMIIGFVLVKAKVVGAEGSKVLSRLENNLFIPALVFGTFARQFTRQTLSTAWKLLLFSFGIEFVVIALAIGFGKIFFKEKFVRNVCVYGLCFANFGFMGNAIVESLFPEHFMMYLIFVLPLWTLIYVWGVPNLLREPQRVQGSKVLSKLKSLVNPMFIALILGAIIGLSGLKMPKVITTVVTSCGNCMSPLAMVLSGMVFATINLKTAFTNLSVYICSVLRLIVFPVIFALVFKFIDINFTWYVCLVCSTAMPLGLNAIVIPAADGKDLTVPAGMAVVSHLLAIITIPIIFMIFL